PTNTVIFRPAPVIDLVPIPKRVKLESKEPKIYDDYLTAKTSLDKEFGSKKVKSRIVARERSQIDPSSIKNVDKFVSNIKEAVKTLPTSDNIKALIEETRPIPPHNINATGVNEVYKLDDVVPPSEFNAIPISSLLRAKTESERLELLPFKTSRFVNSRLFPSLNIKK
ncbi:11958_t:CDS:2, partial [Acaulospora morrowiae]